ncbi:MAG: peptidoglycan-binding domain-containing protein, partial [Oscillospiraceae bacterium]
MKIKKSHFAVIACLCIAIASCFYFANKFDLKNTFDQKATTTLSKIGSKGSEVKAIQEKLKERGIYKGTVDGVYGKGTSEAVKKFQKQNGLTSDGVAGAATLKKLGITIGTIPTASQNTRYLLA